MASSTARDLINDSLRSLGVLASGETATAAEANDALSILNEMLELWNLQRLLVYQIVRTAQTLTGANEQVITGTYTLGSGGDWDISPLTWLHIERITHYDNVLEVETPLTQLTQREYEGITNKTQQAAVPTSWYDDNAYPLRTISFHPVPNSPKQVYIYHWQQFSVVNTLESVLNLPPGYRAAIRYNLAVECAVDFQAPITPELMNRALESKAIVKRHNAPVEFLQTDPAFHMGPGAYDAWTDLALSAPQ